MGAKSDRLLVQESENSDQKSDDGKKVYRPDDGGSGRTGDLHSWYGTQSENENGVQNHVGNGGNDHGRA